MTAADVRLNTRTTTHPPPLFPDSTRNLTAPVSRCSALGSTARERDHLLFSSHRPPAVGRHCVGRQSTKEAVRQDARNISKRATGTLQKTTTASPTLRVVSPSR